MLDDLGQLTRGGALQRRGTNLHRVLDDLLELHAREAENPGVEVLREYDPSIPEISADPDRLTQIFLNLIRNAIQAMEGKGQLLVRTRVESEFRIAATDRPRNPSLSVDIEDSGPGIDPEDLPHIFTPFFTRRPEGTGLGLAVAQHWVVRHDGQIRVDSLPGRGTRIRVSLPLLQMSESSEPRK